jgi:hypothetical protein
VLLLVLAVPVRCLRVKTLRHIETGKWTIPDKRAGIENCRATHKPYPHLRAVEDRRKRFDGKLLPLKPRYREALLAFKGGAAAPAAIEKWRSPSFGMTFVLSTTNGSNEEDAYGQIHRHQRSRQKLHARGDRRSFAGSASTRSRRERAAQRTSRSDKPCVSRASRLTDRAGIWWARIHLCRSPANQRRNDSCEHDLAADCDAAPELAALRPDSLQTFVHRRPRDRGSIYGTLTAQPSPPPSTGGLWAGGSPRVK